MRESAIEDYLTTLVERHGGEIRKVRWIGRRGAPDRLLMFPNGVTCWVELKAPGKGLQPHQEREHHRLQRMGQWVLKVDDKETARALVQECVSMAKLMGFLRGVKGYA